MKKLTVFIIVIIVFNFIYLSFFNVKVYAESEESEEMSIDDYKLLDEGKATVDGQEMNVKVSDSDTGSFASKMATALSSVAAIFSRMMSHATLEGGLYYTDSKFSAKEKGFFTINSLVFGEYILFNSKAYETSRDLNDEIEPSDINITIDGIKEKGAELSQVVSKIGIAFSVPLVLLAIGKTVMAKNASDLATWKKILTRWVLCLVLMFFYGYILSAIDSISDIFIDFFWNVRKSLENSGYNSFEVVVEESIINSIKNTGGVTSLAYSLEFVIIIGLQVVFFFKYIMRTLTILLLFIIFPIIVLIHSMNLMLGKQSDILGNTFKLYILMDFLQPLHALFYIIFIFSLSQIAINVPVLGIILLYAIYRAEKIVQAMLGVEIGSSILSLSSK